MFRHVFESFCWCVKSYTSNITCSHGRERERGGGGSQVWTGVIYFSSTHPLLHRRQRVKWKCAQVQHQSPRMPLVVIRPCVQLCLTCSLSLFLSLSLSLALNNLWTSFYTLTAAEVPCRVFSESSCYLFLLLAEAFLFLEVVTSLF